MHYGGMLGTRLRFTVEDKVTQGSGSMGQVPIEEATCDLKGGSHPQ